MLSRHRLADVRLSGSRKWICIRHCCSRRLFRCFLETEERAETQRRPILGPHRRTAHPKWEEITNTELVLDRDDPLLLRDRARPSVVGMEWSRRGGNVDRRACPAPLANALFTRLVGILDGGAV